FSRCQEKLCAARRQFPMRGFEIVNREADRARPCQRLCGCPILTTYARSYLMEREGGGAGLKLAPPRRLELQRQAEYVAVERDRAAHVRNVDFDVIDFAEHHAPLGDCHANARDAQLLSGSTFESPGILSVHDIKPLRPDASPSRQKPLPPWACWSPDR